MKFDIQVIRLIRQDKTRQDKTPTKVAEVRAEGHLRFARVPQPQTSVDRVSVPSRERERELVTDR